MSIAAALEEARRALLDLSTRNRMLSLPAPGRARGLLHIGRPAGASAGTEPGESGREDAAGTRRRRSRTVAAPAEAKREETPDQPAAPEPPAAAEVAEARSPDGAPGDAAREPAVGQVDGAAASGEPEREEVQRGDDSASPDDTGAREDPAFVLAQLAAGKSFTFEAVRRGEGKKRAEGVAIADAKDAAWRADTALRVELSDDALALRLRQLVLDARAAREESGVASLFLAVGAVVWRDARTPEVARVAPLVFVPVTLEREGVSARFRLRAGSGEAEDNLSLREKLRVEFRVELPIFDAEAPDAWPATVAPLLPPDWRVEADAMALGLFAHSKFLMWRDLDPALHPGLLAHPPLLRLLDADAAAAEPPPFADDADVDAAIPVERLDHAIEVDGSQALAIAAARDGRHLVIQGPPGTGKSQAIVNILAQAVLDGRSVLFVAEKAAALEVVQRRLTALGLGAAVLELHGEDTGKRAVLDELRATLALPLPERMDREAAVQRLGELRGQLNRHAAAMRAEVGGLAVHAVVQRLAVARAGGPAPPFALEGAEGWTAARGAALRDAVAALAANSGRNPWEGVRADLDGPDVLARLPRWVRALAAAPGSLAAATARGEAPLPAAEVPAARALLDDLRRVQAAREDARFAMPGALTRPGLEAAVLARPAGWLGFLDGERRAARELVAAALRVPDDAAALADLLLARAAWARVEASPLPRDPAVLRAAVAWHAEPPPDAATAAGLAAWAEVAAASGLAAPDTFAEAAERLLAMAAEPEALLLWQNFSRARAGAPELAPLASALRDGSLAPADAAGAFERALLEALWRAALRAHPTLAGFDGAGADRLVDSFRAADAARVRLAREEAKRAHAERVAALRNGAEPAGMAFLRGEFERKRGHAPVRTILARASGVVRAAKPILMMSPLSVAQFLANPHHATLPGFPIFDLLVMDEASQIEPVDALGAIARARQFVVVGDDRQMPPTRFFQRITGDDGEEEAPDAALAARDVESILGLANARGVGSALLRWHYRSRHESLIATSNAEFYGGRLLVLPSPKPRSAALGLSLVRVEGRFVGSSNAEEAKVVAEAVLRHARETPGETLGVAAFSVTQRDAILDAVEALRKGSPETEGFFTGHPAEPFFVKNLENVQGDERDAILISVGYGRGGDEKLAMRFGPLSAEGGERRLNVLITRARRRCVVFSGIGAEDIDLARAGGRGVAALKAFLAYAAAGEGRAVAGGAPSPLAEAMAPVVAEAGQEPVPRVGLSGLFLDLAARGSAGFELGIELDGGDWAPLRCARDRDRGRQLALEGMGWRLSRHWSLDWLLQPEAARARLRVALGLEAAVAAAVPDAGLAAPYAEAAPEVPAGMAIEAIPFARLAALLAEIIGVEAPIHEEALRERVRLLWGAAALTPVAQAAIAQALRLATQLHGVREEKPFLLAEEAAPTVPRARHAAMPLLRRAAMVHPAEIEAAGRALLAAQPEATEAEAAAGVVRLLGLEAAAGPAVAARLAMLAGSGRLKFRG